MAGVPSVLLEESLTEERFERHCAVQRVRSLVGGDNGEARRGGAGVIGEELLELKVQLTSVSR